MEVANPAPHKRFVVQGEFDRQNYFTVGTKLFFVDCISV
jgi:hypothetical protein